MDFKIFLLRFVSSFFLLFFFGIIIFFYVDHLNYIIIIVYSVILFEVLLFFKLKKFLIFIYLLLSFIFFEYYLIFLFDLYFFIAFITLIIFFDTFSYIFGSLYGKKKIVPKISPNKTYLGFTFGYILSISLTYVLLMNFYKIPFFEYYLIATMIIIFSFLGDIIQSYFKRISNIKNSSFLIPGHGGFFDRLDGFIFAVFTLPFFNLVL